MTVRFALAFVLLLSACRPPERDFEERAGGAESERETPARDAGLAEDQESEAAAPAASTVPEATATGGPEPSASGSVGAPAPSPGPDPENASEPASSSEPSAPPEPEPVTPEAEPVTPVPEPMTPEPEPATSEPEAVTPEPEPATSEPEAVTPEPATPEPVTPEPEPVSPETEPIGGCEQQLLQNGNFDRGEIGWDTYSTLPGVDLLVAADAPALVQQDVTPYSGEYLAWLGGIPDMEFDEHLTRISQVITIPAEATKLALSGVVWIRTEETEPGLYDATYLDVTNLAGSSVWHPHAFTNAESQEGWVPFAFTLDTVPFAGSDMILEIHAETDLDFVTSFWFDDVRLVASCER